MRTKAVADSVAVIALGGNSITREFEEGNFLNNSPIPVAVSKVP